ncbi:uncharacterized protein LACBIDRAFT_327505 [Laccaria bicolor S238N-H82]|uniref:Predicted protein n=1 Tax=Laccaria bicolor (strain S238N-H82 / ATCC MYA-4686) TaxID=486041 RepID=B0DBX7_LACBS|nr:uncharacterized protein LACBIDRAFT_327505 [Laccaria bicolor S238N-H82]EDR07795.1 predicted protein [Laccaria bicolor S238N-H82]|eukprot:XP_001881584.1 predicted protein [Laccaria bicolor S238N-H82]
MVGPPKERKKRQKRNQPKVEKDTEPTFGTISDAVAQGTSTSKKRSRKSENAAPAHQAPSTIHFQELAQVWEGDRRIPTAASRRSWCLARNINPAPINNWWYRRKAVAKKAKITIPEGTYDLPIGNPPDLSVKIEVEEELRDKLTFQAKKRALTQTATALAGFTSGNDLERISIPSSDPVIFLCNSSETALSVPSKTRSSPHHLIPDAEFTQPKRAYTQSSSPFLKILDTLLIPLNIGRLKVFPARRVVSFVFALIVSLLPGSHILAPHDGSPDLDSCLRTLHLYPPDVAFPEHEPSSRKTQGGRFLCSNSVEADDAITQPSNIPLLFLPDAHRPISRAPSLQNLFPLQARLGSSNDSTDFPFCFTSIAHASSPSLFICLAGSHYSLDGFYLFSASDEIDCACPTPQTDSFPKTNDDWKPYTHTILDDPSYLPSLPDM